MTRTIPKVPIYMNADKDYNISRLYSYLAWREYYKGNFDSVMVPVSEAGVCSICDGFRIAKDDDYGVLRCICDIKEEERELALQLSPYRSPHSRTSLSTIQMWGRSDEEANSLAYAVYICEEWEKHPDKWVTIHGKVGCGKTHILTALATTFGAWALYITAADFEHQVFDALDEDNLNSMIDAIKRAPILLIDDVGADYGSSFPKSNLRKVIDFRYLRAIEYPTVIATNLDRRLMMEYDMRIGDRVFDKNKTHILPIKVPSWRTMHNANDNNI